MPRTSNKTPELVDAEKRLADDMRLGDMRSKEIYQRYLKEEKVSVQVSPLYAPYFGNVLMVSINGVTVCVPADGKQHSIPKTFATEVFRRIKAVDRQRQLMEQQGVPGDKAESYPGENGLI